MQLRYRHLSTVYNLTISGRFTIIEGYSGTGKTYLCSFVRRLNADPDPRHKEVPVPIHAPIVFNAAELDTTSPHLFVIDEHFDEIELRQVIPKLLLSRNYFIIINRDGNKSIPYGIGDIFIMQRSGQKFTMSQRYSRYTCTRNVGGITEVVTEDSEVGHALVKGITRKNILVRSSRGKSMLHSAINPAVKGVVLFDKCGIGGDILRLSVTSRECGWVLFDTESFEYEIGKALFGDEYSEYSTENCLDFPSAEDFYIQQLRTLLRDKYGCVYSKSDPSLVDILTNGRGVQHGVPISIPLQKVQQIYAELRTANG